MGSLLWAALSQMLASNIGVALRCKAEKCLLIFFMFFQGMARLLNDGRIVVMGKPMFFSESQLL